MQGVRSPWLQVDGPLASSPSRPAVLDDTGFETGSLTWRSQMADVPLSDALAALSRFLVGDGSVQETLKRVSDLTVEAVPGADLAGITMFVEGRRRTAVFTDALAPEVDQAQYDTGEGPCLDAFDQQRIFTID